MINYINRIISKIEMKNRKLGKTAKGFVKKTDECFVLVHTGNKPIPKYINDTIDQIKLFNSCQIILVCSKRNEKSIDKVRKNADVVYIEDIPVSYKHKQYIKDMVMNGFALYTTERFFVLEEAIETLGLEKVVHLENDNLVYTNVHKYFKDLSTNNDNLVLTRHNNSQCIGGIMYIPTAGSLSKYTEYLVRSCSDRYLNDMDSLSEFAKQYGVDYAPVVTTGYCHLYEFISAEGIKFDSSYDINAFSGEKSNRVIFDAAALGQYIGGIDKIHDKGDTRGFINQNCLYNPSNFNLVWEIEDGLFVLFVLDGEEKYRVMNLHIHSKQLSKYRSDNKDLLGNIMQNEYSDLIADK